MNAAKKQSDGFFVMDFHGISVRLSYRGFGGKPCALALGVEGIKQELEKTIGALNANCFNESINAVRRLFSIAGVKNAILLFDVLCHPPFLSLWRHAVLCCKAAGSGYSFRPVLWRLSDTKNILSNCEDIPLVQAMNAICDAAKTADTSAVTIEDVVALLGDGYAPIKRDGIAVSFQSASNNEHRFLVNGVPVSYCTNRTAQDISTAFVFDACMQIRDAVLEQREIKPFTQLWGSSFVFRVMQAVCEKEAYAYFEEKARQLTCARERIVTRKLLKDYGYGTWDSCTSAFTDAILSRLEEAENKQGAILIAGNPAELLRTDRWRLSYEKHGTAYLREIDFTKIQSETLREELIAFLRIAYSDDLQTGDCSAVVHQIYRYYNLLSISLSYLGSMDISRMEDVRKYHVSALIQHLKKAKGFSVNQIEETRLYLNRLYRTITFGQDIPSPFGSLPTIERSRAVHHVQPMTDEVMTLIENNLDKLWTVVAVGYILLRATAGRARDIFDLPVSQLQRARDGRYIIRYISSKTGKPNQAIVAERDAEDILAYIEATEHLRTRLGSDAILVYVPPLREGSARQPRVLTSEVYVHQMRKLFRQLNVPNYEEIDTLCTPRNIRARVGSRLFADGHTPTQVANALGNSPQIAFKHYRSLSVREKAMLHKSLYENTMYYLLPENRHSNVADFAAAVVRAQGNATMFGTCKAHEPCPNSKLCSACPALTTKEEKHHESDA